ncbi:hypothetical protein Rsub_07364 [Raphidocelis subcapitata]|uniref:Neuroguidin n=1 Tax=Raphidocelis subcapitata TaxID=307507 RepID=A0A2V0P441_9CHLO|nr:hypothetical protein Rsub_07364 [Raphidocelis subcapitata]|eukprot:GBF94628.1 hypothetical protein Rsub_07364 [Raphidocelis subcapitata]
MPPGPRAKGVAAKAKVGTMKKAAKAKEEDWAAVAGPEDPSDDGSEPTSDADDSSEGASGSSDDSEAGAGRRPQRRGRQPPAPGSSDEESGGDGSDGPGSGASGSGSGSEGDEGAADEAPNGRQRRGGDVEAARHRLAALSADGLALGALEDVPQLLQLLEELKGQLAEVRGRVAPLLAEVQSGGLPTSEGLSYLEAKHLLLLEYCGALVVYLMLKGEGRRVEGHPVVTRLVQLRAFIERARPIDKQLAYQIEKLLRATERAAAGAAADAGGGGGGDGGDGGGGDGGGAGPGPSSFAAGGDDALRYRPNPSALVTKAPLGGAGGGGFELDGDGGGAPGVYRPPRLNPVAMEEDREASRQERRQQVEARRRAKRSSLVKELAQELAGAPEEVEALLPGLDSAAAQATLARLDARAAQEEELMMRVPLKKAEAKRLKAARRAGLSGGALLDGFEDEVGDLLGGVAGLSGRPPGAKRGRGEDAFGGDDEAPGFGGGGGGGGGGARRGGGVEADLFAASKAARAGGGGKKRRNVPATKRVTCVACPQISAALREAVARAGVLLGGTRVVSIVVCDQ